MELYEIIEQKNREKITKRKYTFFLAAGLYFGCVITLIFVHIYLI